MLERPFKVVQQKASDEMGSTYLSLLTKAPGERFISVTRTDEEISVVYEAENADAEASWRCIKISGPMDFGSYRVAHSVPRTKCPLGITGVLCNFTTPLKAAGIPVFAVSTWCVAFWAKNVL